MIDALGSEIREGQEIAYSSISRRVAPLRTGVVEKVEHRISGPDRVFIRANGSGKTVIRVTNEVVTKC